MPFRSVQLPMFRSLFGYGTRVLLRLRQYGLPIGGLLFLRAGLFFRLRVGRFGYCLFGGFFRLRLCKLFLRLFDCALRQFCLFFLRLYGVELCDAFCKCTLCRRAHFAQDQFRRCIYATAQQPARQTPRNIWHQ